MMNGELRHSLMGQPFVPCPEEEEEEEAAPPLPPDRDQKPALNLGSAEQSPLVSPPQRWRVQRDYLCDEAHRK